MINMPNLPTFFILITFASLLQLIIHEAGHLVFGLLSGYRFSSFRIGSFIIMKIDGRLKLKRSPLPGIAGQCLMLPPSPYTETLPVVLYNLGGSILNLLSAFIFIMIHLFILKSGYGAAIMLTLAFAGILVGLLNGVPLQLKLLNNDGHNTLILLKNQSSRRSFWLQLQITGEIANGIRLKEMPDEWFQIPAGQQLDSALSATIAVFAFNRMIDQGEFEAARQTGENLLKDAPGLLGLHRNLIISELIFLDIIKKEPKEKIDLWFTKDFIKFIKASSSMINVSRMMYAYELFIEQNHVKASKHLSGFEKAAKCYPYPSEVTGERGLLHLVQQVYSV